MFKKVSLFVFALSLLLAGCAQKTIKPEMQANIKNVAVASSFGSNMHHVYMGLTIFSNKSQEIDASALNLDSFSREYLVSKLKTKGYNAASFDVVANDNLFSETERQSLLEQARAANYDTLLIMDASSGLPNMPSEVKSGYGLFSRGSLGLYNHAVYNSFSLDVYNVASGELVAGSQGYNPLSWNGSAFDSVDIEHQENFMALSDQDKATVYNAVKSTTQRLIDFAVDEIKI